MFGTILQKAAGNGLFWGLVGSMACKEIEGMQKEGIIRGGIISAISGVALTLVKPAIYCVAKNRELEDYKINALASGATQAIHAAAVYALYSNGILDGEMGSIAIPVMAIGALLFDSSLRHACRTWGSNDKKIIASGDFMLNKF